jgi:hypothetical protein
MRMAPTRVVETAWREMEMDGEDAAANAAPTCRSPCIFVERTSRKLGFAPGPGMGAPCKKIVRSNMVNFISTMEATTIVRKKREGTPQI